MIYDPVPIFKLLQLLAFGVVAFCAFHYLKGARSAWRDYRAGRLPWQTTKHNRKS